MGSQSNHRYQNAYSECFFFPKGIGGIRKCIGTRIGFWILMRRRPMLAITVLVDPSGSEEDLSSAYVRVVYCDTTICSGCEPISESLPSFSEISMSSRCGLTSVSAIAGSKRRLFIS